MLRLTPVTSSPGNHPQRQWPGQPQGPPPDAAHDSWLVPSSIPPSPWTPGASEKTGLHESVRERSASNSSEVRNSLNKTGTRKHHKVGPWLLFLILSSMLLLGIAAGFLAWVWFGNRDDERWRRLMTGDFSTQSITLTSVLVRYSVATLAWITGAMMVSIIVERYGVPLEGVAQASIARYTGAVLPFALGGLAPWSIFTALLPLQVAVGITSQFTSTLLFSDVAPTTVRGFPADLVVAYDFSKELNNVNGRTSDRRPEQDGTSYNRWTFNPTSFETFAEYAEPDQKIVAEGVDDTGPILRAFLPIDSEQIRSSIQEYRGTARVFDARVMCFRPTFTDFNAARIDQIGDATLSSPLYKGTGFIDTKHIPNLYGNGGNATLTFGFTCHLAPPGGYDERQSKNEPKPYWEICESGGNPARMSSLDPLYYLDNPENGEPEHNRLRFGRTFVLMDATNLNVTEFPSRTPGSNTSIGGVEFSIPILNATGKGPWLEFDSVLLAAKNQTDQILCQGCGDVHKKVKATFCMEVMMPEMAPLIHFNITATSGANRTEPKFSWDAERGAYNTTNTRKQLGVRIEGVGNGTTRPSADADRGILFITPESFRDDITAVVQDAVVGEDLFGAVGNEFVASILSPETSTGPLIFCSDCLGDNFDRTKTLYRASAQYFENLMDDILNDTGSPALALQSVNTVRARMAYQKWVSTFTEKTTVNATSFVVVQVPARATGYYVVLAVIATQALLVICIGVLFLKTEFTYLNNSWQVIAQVSAAPDVADIVAQAPMMTDSEVSKYVRSGERSKILGSGGEHVNGEGRYALENGAFVPSRRNGVARGHKSGMNLRWRFSKGRGQFLNSLQA